MKKNNRYKATVILVICTAGFLLSCPFSGTFAGGLLSSLFGASMIGGIADWFGVTALFRKPLGVPFRTEIIPRSREKIFASLVSMVENELLTKEAIISKLDKFDISGKLIRYLDEQDGKRDLTMLVNKLAVDILGRIDPDRAGSYLEKLINDNSDELELFPLFMNAVDWLSENMGDEQVITHTADKINEFILYPGFGTLVNGAVSDIFDQIGKNTEKESAGKRIFFKFVLALSELTNMSPSKLSARLLQEAHEYFKLIKDPDSRQRKGFEKWLEKTAEDFRTNKALREKIQQKGAGILKQASLSTVFTDYVYPYIKNGSQSDKLHKLVEGMVEKITDDFRKNPGEQAALNNFVKSELVRIIGENHSVIGQMVRQRLDMFSNDMLVDLIEDKAGNDLQIIRINGSVVGGIAGMIFFLLTFWI